MDSVTKVSKDKKLAVDLTKPLVHQVGYLGEQYQEWVHMPIVCKDPPRFFESNLAEFFTRTRWWVIPAVWFPVSMFFEWEALRNGYPFNWIPLTVLTGAIFWTLLEYLLHRFLFHMNTNNFWLNTFHYMVHGFHHKYPMDGSRLVFPPAFTLIFVLMLWILSALIKLPYPLRASLFGGGLLMYIIYDLTHYFLHFGTPFTDFHCKMKRYHMNHHFKVQTSGFGVTSTCWDRIFGTMPN
eukprot:Gb_20420 [translate_table: standard]